MLRTLRGRKEGISKRKWLLENECSGPSGVGGKALAEEVAPVVPADLHSLGGELNLPSALTWSLTVGKG